MAAHGLATIKHTRLSEISDDLETQRQTGSRLSPLAPSIQLFYSLLWLTASSSITYPPPPSLLPALSRTPPPSRVNTHYGEHDIHSSSLHWTGSYRLLGSSPSLYQYSGPLLPSLSLQGMYSAPPKLVPCASGTSCELAVLYRDIASPEALKNNDTSKHSTSHNSYVPLSFWRSQS